MKQLKSFAIAILLTMLLPLAALAAGPVECRSVNIVDQDFKFAKNNDFVINMSFVASDLNRLVGNELKFAQACWKLPVFISGNSAKMFIPEIKRKDSGRPPTVVTISLCGAQKGAYMVVAAPKAGKQKLSWKQVTKGPRC